MASARARQLKGAEALGRWCHLNEWGHGGQREGLYGGRYGPHAPKGESSRGLWAFVGNLLQKTTSEFSAFNCVQSK